MIHLLTECSREHLQKKHFLKYECSKCGICFAEEGQLDEHRIVEFCDLLPQTPPKGLTPKMQAILSQRRPNSKHGRQKSEEEKWFDIYHLLFPGDPDPASACGCFT
jgi:hypothetical protein